MQTAQNEQQTTGVTGVAGAAAGIAQQSPVAAGVTYQDYKLIRRNGAVVSFEPNKIAVAMTKAFLAVNGGQGAGSRACARSSSN
jgi:ribonucleoside-diphosphate reductase alpha chain